MGLGLLAAGPAIAQFPLQGFLYNWDRPALGDALSVFVRWNTTTEIDVTRIDRSDYPEWGLTPAGTTQIQGCFFWISDNNDATVEQFNLVGFEESLTQPNFPDMTVPRMNVGPIQMPPTGVPAGNVAWRLSVGLGQPVSFAGNRDVFLGVGLPAILSLSPLDGLFLGSVGVDPANAPFPFDVPGPRGQQGQQIAQDSYICYVPTGQAPRYVPSSPISAEQLAFDVMLPSGVSGGTALAQTPQTNFPTSNVLGTSDFLSGLHPNLQRGDLIGFSLTTHTAQIAAPAFGVVLLAFGPSPIGSVPINGIAGLDPASTGNVCLDFTTAMQFFIVLNTGQTNSLANMVEGQFMYPVNPAERALVQTLPSPFDIWWQGFAVDASAGTLKLRASGCAIQHIK